MASTRFDFNTTTKKNLEIAAEEGWAIEQSEHGKDHWKIRLSHPLCPSAPTFIAAKHGDGNNAMVKFLVTETKRVWQRERARAEAEQPEPAPEPKSDTGYVIPAPNPDFVPPVPAATKTKPTKTEPSFDDKVQHTIETLVAWLDDQYKAGMRQFTRATFNIQRRTQLGLPVGDEASAILTAALERLVKLHIISAGSLPAKNSNRTLKAYRLNTFNGTTILDVYAGDAKIAAPPKPSANEPSWLSPDLLEAASEEQKPPEPAPQPVKQTDFDGALSRRKDKLIDLLILTDDLEELVRMIVESGDVQEGVHILKRVEALSRTKTQS
jgi:hypothetical protein